MTKPNYTHLSFLVDRSGSMASIQKDAEGGINSLIKEQAKVEGEMTVALYQFDTAYEKVFGPIDVKDAPNFNLVPRGLTALLDSTYKAIVDTGEYLSSLPEEERPSKVLFAIVTDGAENASREISLEQVKALVSQQTSNYNWEFIYIGANVDAFGVSSSLGISKGVAYTANSASNMTMYSSLSRGITSARVNSVALDSAMPDEIDSEGNEVWHNNSASK